MSVGEQAWFVVGIGGFLILLEGTVTLIANLIAKYKKLNIPEAGYRAIAGFVIFGLALYKLLTL